MLMTASTIPRGERGAFVVAVAGEQRQADGPAADADLVVMATTPFAVIHVNAAPLRRISQLTPWGLAGLRYDSTTRLWPVRSTH
jgi:hypothetical protein